MRLLIHDYAGHAFPVDLSRELSRRGCEVIHAFAGELLTPRGDLRRNPEDPPGLRFLEVPMNTNYRRDKYRFIRRRSYELAYGRELSRLIETERPSLVLSGQTPSEPQWLAIKRSNELNIPFISWIQDFYSLAVGQLAAKKSAILGKLAGAYYSHIDRRCFSRSAHTIPISKDFIPLLSQYGVAENRISVIENWGMISKIPRVDKQNEWALEHGLNEKRVFLYSGTLAMKHNPEPLIHLAKHFRGYPDVEVVVVSEGPGAKFIRDSAKSEKLCNLRVFPFQPFEYLPNILGAADVFVALLEPDAGIFSVPSKILSYFCAGKPTLAMMPSENLSAKLISENRAGIVREPGDVDGFVIAGEKLLNDKELRTEMGDSARAYAEENFKINMVADRFLRIFHSCLNS